MASLVVVDVGRHTCILNELLGSMSQHPRLVATHHVLKKPYRSPNRLAGGEVAPPFWPLLILSIHSHATSLAIAETYCALRELLLGTNANTERHFSGWFPITSTLVGCTNKFNGSISINYQAELAVIKP